MTAVAAPPDAKAAREASPQARFAGVATFAFSLLIAAALTFERASAIWTSNAFFDSDDAMRAVQVRDFIAGQSWFDLVAHRVDPSAGLAMHWSRVVDLPLAGLLRFFGLFLAPNHVEPAARLTFSFALLALLFAMVGRLAAILWRPATRPAAIWLTLLSGAVFVQFAPGRIDHHAPQIVILLAALGCLLQGLEPARSWRLAAAAVLMALSVAISLENLPFFVVMIAALPLLFIVDGDGAPLMRFSLGALLAFPALYVATVPSSAYSASACDAFSAVHLAAGLTGSLSLGLLGLVSRRLATPRARFLGALAAGGATALAVVLIAPGCVGDPLTGLDPLLRDLWLSRVAEARPLLSFFAASPGVVIATAAPVALSFAVALLLGARANGVARRRYYLVAALIATGFAAGLWQSRVFTSVTPIAMAALAVGLKRLFDAVPVSEALRGALVATAGLVVSPVGLALAMPPPAADDATAGERGCLAPRLYTHLASLPPARVAASFDIGSHVLAQTPHSVFAAPYHRNNHGNRLVADAFLARPEKAAALLRAGGADLLLWCAAQKKPSIFAKAAPDGLAAALERGDIPAWLEQKSPAGAPLLVFAVRLAQD